MSRESEINPHEERTEKRLGLWLPDNVHVHINFISHGTAEDISHLRERLEAADVYIPERESHPTDFRENMQRIAYGERDAYEAEQIRINQCMKSEDGKAFYKAEIDAVFGTGVAVCLIDVSSSDKLGGVTGLLLGRIHKRKIGYERTIDAVNRRYWIAGEAVRRRDAHMLQNLGPELQRAKQLKATGETLQVYMWAGHSHTPLYHALHEYSQEPLNRARGITVSKELPSKPHVYPLKSKLLRSATLAKPNESREVEVDYARSSLWLLNMVGEIDLEDLPEDETTELARRLTQQEKRDLHYYRRILRRPNSARAISIHNRIVDLADEIVEEVEDSPNAGAEL